MPAKRQRISYLSRAASREAGTFETRVIFYGDELRFTQVQRNLERFRSFVKNPQLYLHLADMFFTRLYV